MFNTKLDFEGFLDYVLRCWVGVKYSYGVAMLSEVRFKFGSLRMLSMVFLRSKSR
jgi:hypothetical protein